MFGLFAKKRKKLGKLKNRFGKPIYLEDLEARTIAGAYIHLIGLVDWGAKGEPKYRFLENDTVLEIEKRAVGKLIGKKGSVIVPIKEKFGNGEDDPFQVREWKKEKPIVKTDAKPKKRRKPKSTQGVNNVNVA